METATVIPWPEDEPVIPLWPIAGQVFGMSRPKAYTLAQQGQFPCPVIRIGDRWMVLTSELRKAVGLPINRPQAS